MTDLAKLNYNPDVLSCLANLSNDEVFTPPDVVNQMLDRLPERLWSDPNAKFLDPVSKSGVFLREIAKRLIKGLETQIPDLQTRLNHIFSQQLYGIAITELTALLSRRSLYCAKKANGEYSICTVFETEEGNIFKPKAEHKWEGGKCSECGAAQAVYDRFDHQENHAYSFIHQQARKELGLETMKFDVIIGNPPYQLRTGDQTAQALPIYHKFILQAKKLKPDYLVMITPSRWFAGGMGLNDFREEMLNDQSLQEIHDFPDATDVFPGVSIEGGVNYFLWSKNHKDKCDVFSYENGKCISVMNRKLLEDGSDVFIRHNEAVSIYQKVRKFNEENFSDLVSVVSPFGLPTSFKKYKKAEYKNAVKLYGTKFIGYMNREDIENGFDLIDKYKVYITSAYGAGKTYPQQVLNKPFVGKPNSCSTQTYLVINPTDNEIECENIITYIQTRFFRFLVSLRKNTQHCNRSVYQFVPQQNFSKPWTDEELYQKYGLSEDEIAFIEKMVRPMELEDE